SWSAEGGELALEISSQFALAREAIRLVPRTSAGELSRQVELARTERAGEIARAVGKHFIGINLKRVALNSENGRFAEIFFETTARERIAMLSDVTEKMTPESLLTSAFKWRERINARSRRPINELWIAAPKRQARALQKLAALLRPGERSVIQVILLQPEKEPACRLLRGLAVSDLWREKPQKLTLPEIIENSETAKRIAGRSPDKIDIIHSKQGETLRFHGLPFARVRTMLGREKAWLGVERERRPLTEESQGETAALINDLTLNRRFDSENRRHRHYVLSPESWLESILLRNIKLLDANLILSPIYNQFRASNDKIDLLAIRRDGRLVIIELKTSPDREMVFQAADYWRKIELQRRRGQLAKARVFGDLEILDKPALVYAVAPALSFHRDFEYFARMLSPEVELWRFELHEDWRRKIKVIARKSCGERE
ncbi:MAG TPA: hypothetical protein VK468_04980, partial [Pyrinomonadaceae bacterium]|nr:hypothetical protein [Pyrinomonadaceae bacterium]